MAGKSKKTIVCSHCYVESNIKEMEKIEVTYEEGVNLNHYVYVHKKCVNKFLTNSEVE